MPALADSISGGADFYGAGVGVAVAGVGLGVVAAGAGVAENCCDCPAELPCVLSEMAGTAVGDAAGGGAPAPTRAAPPPNTTNRIAENT